jgi:hypothetical protein
MFFAIFEFFLKIYQNTGQKLGSNTQHCQIKNLFDQLDYCQILFSKMISSHFDSFIKVVVLDADKFGLLNRLILISEAQDISI